MEELIPVVLFLVVFGVFALRFWFNFRSRQEIQLTVRTALEKGQELSPEVLERLSDSLTTKFSDLRRGIISIAIAVGVFAFAHMIDEEDATGPLLGISAFPLAIGLAYLGLWYFTKDK